MPNLHFWEAKVSNNAEFQDTMQAALKWVAYDIWKSPTSTPADKEFAWNVFMVPSETERYGRFFGNIALYNDVLRGQVIDITTGVVKPKDMDEATLRSVIRGAWAVARDQPTPEGV